MSFTTRKCGAEKLEDIDGTYFPKTKEYRSLDDAQRFGTLYEWADRYAKLTALAVAAKHLGVEAPKDISITEIEGNTFCIDSIKGIAIDPKQEVSIPEADITLYKEVKKRLEGYKRQIEKLEERRNELEKIMEKTDSEIDELRDVRNKLERLFRTERGDIAQIERLKEKYPDIEEML